MLSSKLKKLYNKKDLPKIKVILLKSIKWLVLFISLLIFIIITESVFKKEYLEIDIFGYQFVSKYLINDFLTPIAKFITEFGSGVVMIFVAFSLLLIIKNKKIGVAIFSNLWLVALLNYLLKNVLQRKRPIGYQIIKETGYSFPSGHSMVSLAFYGYLIYLIYKYVKNKYLKWTIILLLSILIIAIGISRIYLGVHYTSDVLAGFLLGISYLIVYISVTKKFVLEK